MSRLSLRTIVLIREVKRKMLREKFFRPINFAGLRARLADRLDRDDADPLAGLLAKKPNESGLFEVPILCKHFFQTMLFHQHKT
jgi:hypothetical protein